MKKLTKISIPDAITFADLQLQRDPDGAVSYNTEPIELVCTMNHLDLAVMDEDDASTLIVRWYAAHRAAGGSPDPVAEDLIAEVAAEDVHGGGFSHEPGRA